MSEKRAVLLKQGCNSDAISIMQLENFDCPYHTRIIVAH